MLTIQRKPRLREMFETFLLGQVQKNDIRISAYEKVFFDFDEDRNGVINKEDIVLKLKQSMPAELALKEAERLLKIIDNDKSGAIDFSEFLRCALEEDIFICKENLHRAFCYFDKNRSDSIEKTEVMAWLAEGAIIPMNVIEDLIEEADKNHDGEIDLEEFENLLLEKISEDDEESSFDSIN
jgi:calcium-binding protein CML